MQQKGTPESYFDWGELRCKQDTSNLVNIKDNTLATSK